MPILFSKNTRSKNVLARSFKPNQKPMFPAKYLAASAVVGGLLASASTYAQEATAQRQVNEPKSGRVTFPVQITANPNPNADVNWDDVASCTVYGSIVAISTINASVAAGHGAIAATGDDSASPDEDFVLSKNNYSITVKPSRNAQEQLVFDVTSDEVIFEILADDEVEMSESVRYTQTSYGVTCSGSASSESSNVGMDYSHFGVTGTYGSFIINDAVESQIPSTAIPVRQKSLSAQLNSLRNLSLHNSITRDRSIAKEIERARRSSGLRMDNLRVSLHGQNLPAGGVLGGAAGDASDDSDRWGVFVTGNIDMGEQEKNTEFESDFRSSMLISGVDYKLSNSVVVGAALTYSDTDAGDDETANTDFKRSSLSLFGSVYSSETLYLNLMMTYGASAYDLDRRIARDDGGEDVGRATTDGDELSGSIATGYNWHHQNINVRFFSFLNYVDSGIDGYSESVVGASSAAQVDDIDLQSLIGNLGVELSWNMNTRMGVFVPMLSIAQERQFENDPVAITGRFMEGQDVGEFGYSTSNRDNDYLNAQLGLSAVLKNSVSAFVSYDTYVNREDLASSQWSIGARWEY
ncbi:MAG: autotransporter outer membrane beta-barrel domain-containing protein [Marinagarivorans sp.]|nr:autotransporter outer membrane beta-barrel domain-containing protein [Marinagarivorans sp.]